MWEPHHPTWFTAKAWQCQESYFLQFLQQIPNSLANNSQHWPISDWKFPDFNRWPLPPTDNLLYTFQKSWVLAPTYLSAADLFKRLIL